MLEYLLGTDTSGPFKECIRTRDADLHVPALCDVEIAAGLRRAVMQKTLSVQRAAEALGDYMDLPLTRHGHQSLLARIFDLRANFSAYDAAYVALTERIDADLLTADEKLGRSVRAHTSIELLP